MTGTMKHGFSTLNRLLGKKSKDDIPSTIPANNNGNTNGKTTVSLLSRSMTNLDTTSQYNKIVPLAAMNNAPFEQTFRITVCLPRDQLFVARVGAKTKLEQLLDMTCTNKQLDRDKYEFRHPADNSQVYHNDLTIGEVGLNEIRLVAKSDKDQNFNLDDLSRMRAGTRSSYAGTSTSSDHTSRAPTAVNGHLINGRGGVNNHHREFTAAKTSSTVSPYSSTNSLNSVDSSHSRGTTGGSHQPATTAVAPVAPMRKKRVAPRPPSQNSIPEHPPSSSIRKNHFHVSSPNLVTNHHLTEPHHLIQQHKINGDAVNGVTNGSKIEKIERSPELVKEVAISNLSSPTYTNGNGSSMTHLTGSVTDLNRSLSRTSSDASEFGPELVPRRNGLLKKKKAAPAPPPRSRENLTPTPPVPTPRTVTKIPENVDPEPERSSPKETVLPNGNVSKVMLNMDAKPEIVVKPIESPTIPTNGKPIESPSIPTNGNINVKQNGSPVSIAVVRSQELQNIKTTDPSSDEDDEHKINIYNLKSGACVQAEVTQDDGRHLTEVEQKKAVQGLITEVVNESLMAKNTIQIQNGDGVKMNETSTDPQTPVLILETRPEIRPETPASANRLESPLDWTYTLPAPPNFADNNNNSLSKKNPINDTPTLTETIPNNYVHYEDDEDNMTIRSATTLVSDVIIKPVIKERIPLVDEPLMIQMNLNNSNSESSDFNSSSTLTSGSANGDNVKFDEEKSPKPKKLIINSDIEDGYHGDENHLKTFATQNIINTLEKRREKYIENELELLTKIDDIPQEPKMDYNSMNRNFESFEMVVTEQERALNILNQGNCNEPISLPFNPPVAEKEPTIDPEPEPEFRKVREYIRRSSSTKPTPKVVQRSDSFHSTRYQDKSEDQPKSGSDLNTSDLSSRSSSYISLLGAQKFEQRRNSFLNDLENSRNAFNRRASSELSISDTPSLQSLEVMKSILSNSKKPSGNNESLQIRRSQPYIENFTQELELAEQKIEVKHVEKSSIELKVVQKPVQIVREEPAKEQPAKEEPVKEELVKEEPKKWVYTGPPTINLGSWSERPKVSVCIKLDSDYRFKQPNSGQTPDVVPVIIERKEVKLTEVKEIIKKEEEKLPIVRGVEFKKPIIPAESPEIVPKPFVSNPVIAKKPLTRPVSVHMGAMSNKYTPVVRGFNWIKDDSEEIKSTSINPVLTRSHSTFTVKTNDVKVEDQVAKTEVPVVATSNGRPNGVHDDKPVLFSQFQLRKTGLKEKILAQPDTNGVPVNKTVVDGPKSMPYLTKTVVTPQQQVKITPTPPQPPPAPTQSPPPAFQNPLAQLSQTQPNHLRPIVRGVVTKKNIPSPEIDPRNQLLDSIRSFNFNKLRKM